MATELLDPLKRLLQLQLKGFGARELQISIIEAIGASGRCIR
jgi:hypothetical protein